MHDFLVPDKVKARLYPVVLDLFSSQDFHKVNIREISRRSGLSTSTLYRYYPSKEAMVFTVLDEKIAEIGSGLRHHLEGLESVREMAHKSFWVTFDFYDRNPGVAITAFVTVPMRTWMQTATYRNEATGHLIAEIVRKGKDRGEIDPAVTATQVADLYYMYCYRQIHLWYYHGCRWHLVDTIPRFFDLFWKAVCA
jgi:AcrR family transcriptional regulator